MVHFLRIWLDLKLCVNSNRRSLVSLLARLPASVSNIINVFLVISSDFSNENLSIASETYTCVGGTCYRALICCGCR